MLALGVGLLDEGVDLVLPRAEDGCVVVDQGQVLSLAVAQTLTVLVVQGVEHDVALEGLLGLHELLGELVEGLDELLLGVSLAHLPLSLVHSVDHGLVDVVDEGPHDANGVLVDLSEEDLLVVGALRVDWAVILSVTEEVDTLASQFDGRAYQKNSEPLITAVLRI